MCVIVVPYRGLSGPQTYWVNAPRLVLVARWSHGATVVCSCARVDRYFSKVGLDLEVHNYPKEPNVATAHS